MSTRWIHVAAAGLIALLAVGGCGAASPGAPGEPPWPAGRTFLSTAVTDHGVARTLAPGTRIQLGFTDDGTVTANAGCNHLSGAGRLNLDQLVITDLAMTEMGCDARRAEQDQWLAALLTGSPKLALTGDTLTLSTTDAAITFTDRRVADPDRPLAGTRWAADTIVDIDSASSIPTGASATLEIAAGGTFRATTGCAGGLLTGAAGVHDGRVAFTAVKSTPCTGAANALDAAIRATLSGEVTYTITARRLTLTAPDGHGVGFTAAT